MRTKESSIRYKIYESALETGNEDFYYLLDEGILDDLVNKVKGLFSKEDQAVVDKASEELEKPLATIVQKLQAAKKKPDEIKSFINNVVEKILTAAPKGGSAAAGAEGGAGSAPAGTPVAADSEQAKGAMAAAAAQAAGQDPKKAVEKAADLSGDKVYSALVNSFAKQTKVPVEKVKAILDYITKNKLLTTEGRLVSVFDLRRVLNEHSIAEQSLAVLERWQSLAGVDNSLMVETKADIVKGLLGRLKNVKGDQVLSTVKGLKDKIPGLSKQLQNQFDDLLKKHSTNPADLQAKITEFLGSIAGSKGAEGGEAAAGKEGGGATPEVTPETEKKFGPLSDKLIGRLKGVKKPEILAVLKALDDSNLKVEV